MLVFIELQYYKDMLVDTTLVVVLEVAVVRFPILVVSSMPVML